ncbi:MAG: hypothetical protein H7Y38_10410, partial [Armatimonadetes bacterium]|nr:hypothetical protein [Armatimonadota bacterium]
DTGETYFDPTEPAADRSPVVANEFAPVSQTDGANTTADTSPLPPLVTNEFAPALIALELATFALLACLLTFVNRFLGRFVPLDDLPKIGEHLLASVYFAGLLYALMRMTRAAALLTVSAPTLLIMGLALAAPMGAVLFSERAQIAAPAWLILTAGNLFLPVGVALIGTAVGRIIRHPNTLLAAAGFAIFFDIVVVTMGTVAVLTQTGSQLISAVSVGAGVALPQSSEKTWAIITGVTIGPADVLFLSVFFASIYLLRLEGAATFRWVFGLLLLALLEVEWVGLPVPALAPMGIAVLVANAKHARFTAQEKRDLKIGAVFAAVCAGIIVYQARAYGLREAARQLAEQKRRIGWEDIAPVGAAKIYVIMQILPDSRAQKAGLRAGDVVKTINGVPPADLAKEGKLPDVLKNAAQTGVTLSIKSGDQPKARDVVFAPVRD